MSSLAENITLPANETGLLVQAVQGTLGEMPPNSDNDNKTLEDCDSFSVNTPADKQ